MACVNLQRSQTGTHTTLLPRTSHCFDCEHRCYCYSALPPSPAPPPPLSDAVPNDRSQVKVTVSGLLPARTCGEVQGHRVNSHSQSRTKTVTGEPTAVVGLFSRSMVIAAHRLAQTQPPSLPHRTCMLSVFVFVLADV